MQLRNLCEFCYLRNVFSFSLFLLPVVWQDLLTRSQKGFKVLKESGSCSLSSLCLSYHFLWKVMEALPSSPSTNCHCGEHFPKDYCHWPLPFVSLWLHSHYPWFQWLAGQHGGNYYSCSNPYCHIWEKESSMGLLTLHHSAHFFMPSFLSTHSHTGQLHNRSILLPIHLPVKCLDRPLSALMMHRGVNDFKEKQCHFLDLWMC